MLSPRERLMLLNLIPGIGSAALRRLLDAFGDLTRLWSASMEELQRMGGASPALARRIVAMRADERRLAQELALATRAEARVVTLDDAEYPARLRQISDPPLALYVRGSLASAGEPSVAIVGSRLASRYGLEIAERLAYDLALRGVTVISGLARGIDSGAHRGALKATGATIAVLGGGLSRLYPPEHAPLAAQIVAGGGVVLSEYPMETEPVGFNFPRRNRIISGLSLGVVIVEAAARSGALITADCALEQGREVFAIPGPMTSATSQGTHQLLKQGARLVTSVDDILEELRLVAQSPEPRAATALPIGSQLPAPEQRVLACLTAEEPSHIDDIATQAGLVMPETSVALLQLELKRLVKQLPGKRFVRTTAHSTQHPPQPVADPPRRVAGTAHGVG